MEYLLNDHSNLCFVQVHVGWYAWCYSCDIKLSAFFFVLEKLVISFFVLLDCCYFCFYCFYSVQYEHLLTIPLPVSVVITN